MVVVLSLLSSMLWTTEKVVCHPTVKWGVRCIGWSSIHCIQGCDQRTSCERCWYCERSPCLGSWPWCEEWGLPRLRRCLIFMSWTLMPSPVLTALSILFSYQLRTKYMEAAEARHAYFIPFVTSVDGVLGCEANSVMKLLATIITLK